LNIIVLASCDIGDGPGLSSHVQNSGNILAVIVRQSKSFSKNKQSDLHMSSKARIDGGPKKPTTWTAREDYQVFYGNFILKKFSNQK
jgi:hypothetical protein